jgi:hypothetical protein
MLSIMALYTEDIIHHCDLLLWVCVSLTLKKYEYMIVVLARGWPHSFGG